MGATWRPHRKDKKGKVKSWLVTVHQGGQKAYKVVHSESDAKALVTLIHKHELAGTNVVQSMKEARKAAEAQPTVAVLPTLKDGLTEWLETQTRVKGDDQIRESTADNYRHKLQKWVWPTLGNLPVDQVTAQHLGDIILKVREAGRSRAVIEHIVNPIRRYYAHLVLKRVVKSSPATADLLRPFIGKPRKKPRLSSEEFFAQEEAPQLLATAKALWPRWYPFILTSLLAGLRWGESAALRKTDIDWRKGNLHIQRTVSLRGKRLEACKDREGRSVKMSPALQTALRSHLEAMKLDGEVKDWSTEQRQLVFPTPEGCVIRYSNFRERVWEPLLAKAGLPHRSFHATRHSFATWLLSAGADLRWVQKQLGHSSVSQTADVYGHLQPDRHDSIIEELDKYLL